ncbi:MAG: endonuclease, partial [Paramuribaculum sp.]|nr:endonuclease [Paramuribaculum sp.]
MKIFTKSSLWVSMAIAAFGSASAEIPSGYYDSCEGKTGQALLTALYQKITNHTNVGYDGLWDVYKVSDVRADGTLWDIYTTKAWSTNFTKCGNYKVIGDCVNREHSMPKSVWGGGKSAQYSDAFHLYPTDGKVNGQRSNYPYGECANGTRLANNGSVQALGRLGSCTFSGYSGTVFEPDDQYKGDLARSYFYMAACYNNLIGSWTQGEMGNMMGGNNYPVFKTWAVNLLLKWARQDQVSQKEIDRNEAVYSFQKNRNPFIDHPELVEYIWGDKVGQAWYAGASAEQSDILQPVQNVTLDMGIAAVNLEKTYQLTVKTKGVEGNVYLSVYDSDRALSLNTTSISAAQANAGYSLTIKCKASKAGTVMGTLSI